MLQETEKLLSDITNAAKLKQIKYIKRKERINRWIKYLKMFVIVLVSLLFLIRPDIIGAYIAFVLKEFLSPIYNTLTQL
jgi:t-SNARE complex subunit (syntaxin)